MSSKRSSNNQLRLEEVTGYVLIGGVVISLFFEVLGMSVIYYTNGQLSISEEPNVFLKGQSFFNLLGGLFQAEYAQTYGFLLMAFGIVILIATPYVRIITSMLFFAWKRDAKHFWMTIFVLLVLTMSLALY